MVPNWEHEYQSSGSIDMPIGSPVHQPGMHIKGGYMKKSLVLVGMLFLAGCSGFEQIGQSIEGDSPVTFVYDRDGRVVAAAIEDEHHVVLTRGVIDSYTVDQDHAQVLLHCKRKYTSEEMAAIRAASSSKNHSWYTGCTTLTNPTLAKDSSKIEKVAGVAMAGAVAFGLHQVGRGLGKSGDHVVQQGGGSSAEGGSVNQNNGNTSTRSIKQTNTNNINVK